MQRKLIACSDTADKADPVVLPYSDFCFICIKNIGESRRWIVVFPSFRKHDRNYVNSAR
jgi:hypothetical protein